MLEELFISRVRVKILQLFLASSQDSLFHVREIVRRVDEEINAVRRELSGLGGNLVKNKGKLGKVKFAFLTTRFLKGAKSTTDDVDLLIVGQIVLPELQAIIADEQAKREQEINYSFMDEAEFQFRVKRRDPFILKVLTQPKVMIFGDEDELFEGVMV